MTAANSPSPPQRGAGYIRYSSDKQADSFSLEAQKQQILVRAAKDGVMVVDFYTDEAQSAYRQKNRPGIRTMLEADPNEPERRNLRRLRSRCRSGRLRLPGTGIAEAG